MVGRSSSPARSSHSHSHSRSSSFRPVTPSRPPVYHSVAPPIHTPIPMAAPAPAPAKPSFGTIVKEGIASGIGTSVGMRIAGLFGLGPQVSVKHEAPSSHPQTTTVPYWYPDYKQCLEKGDQKETCEERWVPEAERGKH